MRITSIILSLLVHVFIVSVAIYYPQAVKEPSIDLDKPVHEVQLVNLEEKRPTPKQSREPKEQEVPEKEKEEAPEDSPEKKKDISQPEKEESKPKPEKVQEKTSEKSEPEPEPEPELEPEPEPEPEKKDKETGPSPEELLDKAMSDIEKDVQDQEEQRRDTLKGALAQLKKESEQNRAAGKNGSAGKSSYTKEIYGRILEEKIKDNWSYPVFSEKENLQTEVKLFLDNKGNITNFTIVSDSGDKDFDRSVVRAVRTTEKLPTPPQELEEITITFNLQEKM